MNCKKCNTKIVASNKYCVHCGSFLPLNTKKTLKTNKNLTLNKYYGRQFQYIRKNEHSDFNFAAYIFFPLHLLYRRCISRFLQIALPILLVWAFCIGIAIMLPNNNIAYIMTFTPVLVCPIIYICLAIYNGATFNRYYYSKYCGNAHVHKSKKSVVIFSITLLIYVMLMLSAFFITRYSYYLYYFNTPHNGQVPPYYEPAPQPEQNDNFSFLLF